MKDPEASIDADSPRVDASKRSRQQWTVPAVKLLPRLNELTLQSGAIPGGGGTGGGGSTVIP